MKFYRYWSIETADFPYEGELKRFTSYGRSQLSLDDAKRDGQERLSRVRKRIEGEDCPIRNTRWIFVKK